MEMVQLLFLSLLVLFITIALGFILKQLLSGTSSPEKLTEKYAGSAEKDNVFVKKYQEADIEYYKGFVGRIGVILVLLMLLFAFNRSKKEKKIQVLQMEIFEDTDAPPPPTQQVKPPPPPPPPPETIIIVEDDKVVEDDPIIADIEVSAKEEVKIVEVKIEKPAKVFVPVEPEEPEIFTIVEQMPEFPGGTEALYKFIGNNMKYPAIARENSIEGLCVVQFVVNEDGSITDVKVLKDIGGGCGDEAARIVKKMPKWKPGKQRGKAVRVQYNLPIRFKLE